MTGLQSLPVPVPVPVPHAALSVHDQIWRCDVSVSVSVSSRFSPAHTACLDC